MGGPSYCENTEFEHLKVSNSEAEAPEFHKGVRGHAPTGFVEYLNPIGAIWGTFGGIFAMWGALCKSTLCYIGKRVPGYWL